MNLSSQFPEGFGDLNSIMVYLHTLRGELETIESVIRRIAGEELSGATAALETRMREIAREEIDNT